MGNGSSGISNQDLMQAKNGIEQIKRYYSERIVGQQELGESLLICLLANGHILLESVPGLAKTTAAKALTNAVAGRFSRIQCTPDLLPSDIIGGQIFNYAKNAFEIKLGPVFANFVLLDEINRSSAKTQSAMLEAMQERQTTIGGRVFKLPEIFIVIATQNPIEQEGTYSLAEAQMDRFLMKETLDYPSAEEEVIVLDRIESGVIDTSKAIVNLQYINYLQELTKKVFVDKKIKRYITEIVRATRYPREYIREDLARYVTTGASTRACIAFMECSKALALMQGRDYVTPDDIKAVAFRILRHRIALSFSAVASNVKQEQIIDAILSRVPTP